MQIDINKAYFKLFLITFILIITVLMPSCRSTRHVPEGEYLLKKVEFECDNPDIKSDDLLSTLKQKPNRKTLFVIKFHLGIYNIFKTEKDSTFFSKIAEVVGEPPSIFSDYETNKSLNNMKSYLESQSYYDTKIEYIPEYSKNKKKVSVKYIIKTGEPYTISSIKYDITDPKIMELVCLDSTNSLLKVNNNLNREILQNEMERITRMLKSNGYYYFSINNIHYYADTTKTSHKTDLTLAIRKSFLEQDLHNNDIFIPQMIRNIHIYPDYSSQLYIADKEEYEKNLDTVIFNGYKIIYHDKIKIKPSAIIQSCFINIGDRYSITNIEKTHSHFASIKQFRLINIKLNPSEDVFLDSQKEKFLDTHIYLTPLKKQNITTELEGNNTSGNIGMSGALLYSNRNLFKGAQVFTAKGILAFQTLTSTIDNNKIKFFNTLEYGGELKLNIPRLMIPFYENYDFIKNHNPHTQIGALFNYQKRPEYTRTIANSSFGYIWKGGKNNYFTHVINPIELYLVKIFNFNTEFKNEIENSFLKFSYEDQLLTVISYDLLYNNQNINKLKNFSMLWFNIETSGNIPTLIYKWSGKEKVDNSYKFQGIEFSQFIKTDIDYKYYQILNEKHQLVYRAFIGIGFPYGNSTKGLPFIKKYFIGGANDLRAWKVRSLGPGSYNNPTSNIEQNGDMKLVLNLEYRFNIISMLNGALFIDAGNVWSINKNDSRTGALFEFNRFYKEFALGTGFGFRLDFSLFIIRLDFGVPLYDPTYPSKDKWLGALKTLELRDFTLNFGIGFPF